MHNDMYPIIAQELVKVLPDNWEKVCLYVQPTDDTYEVFFHVLVDGHFIQCFELEKQFSITRQELRQCFSILNTIIKPDYQEKHWYVLTYILDKSGKFITEYEYIDHSEHSLDYKKQWKNKYLQL